MAGPDVRAQLLVAATRLFAQRGFDGSSLQDIADAVGVRKPSLLYHFASKDELRQAVLEEVLARWNDRLPRVLVAATAGTDQFEGVTREILSFFAEDPDRARLLAREALDRPAEIRELLKKHVRPVIANLAEYVRKGQARGTVHSDVDPEAYLFHMVSVLVCGVAFTDSFGSLMPRHAPEGSPRERLLRELARMGRAALLREP
ncbi:MAG: TetR/AcrR family transcriptional regulator [Polyangiaceae bacterium]|nr:TetR/AcrR family transcriptional regulator [Polyangiaceae bacterium]